MFSGVHQAQARYQLDSKNSTTESATRAEGGVPMPFTVENFKANYHPGLFGFGGRANWLQRNGVELTQEIAVQLAENDPKSATAQALRAMGIDFNESAPARVPRNFEKTFLSNYAPGFCGGRVGWLVKNGVHVTRKIVEDLANHNRCSETAIALARMDFFPLKEQAEAARSSQLPGDSPMCGGLGAGHMLSSDVAPVQSSEPLPPQRADTPPQRADTPPQRADTPPQRADTPPQRADTPPQRADTPPQRADTPPQRADTPPQRADTPPQRADTPPQRADTPPPTPSCEVTPSASASRSRTQPPAVVLTPLTSLSSPTPVSWSAILTQPSTPVPTSPPSPSASLAAQTFPPPPVSDIETSSTPAPAIPIPVPPPSPPAQVAGSLAGGVSMAVPFAPIRAHRTPAEATAEATQRAAAVALPHTSTLSSIPALGEDPAFPPLPLTPAEKPAESVVVRSTVSTPLPSMPTSPAVADPQDVILPASTVFGTALANGQPINRSFYGISHKSWSTNVQQRVGSDIAYDVLQSEAFAALRAMHDSP